MRVGTWSLRTIWLILVACFAVSLVVAAMAALNTALPDIARDVHASSSDMTWIIDGYTLVLAALLLPAGALGDRFGRRGILMIGLVIFGFASLAAVWVDTPTALILTRCAAGVGAALIMPTTLSLITAGVPREQRAIGVSVWAAVAGIGAILGFFVTGVLLMFFSWHSVFIAFAISAAGTLALTFTVGSSKDDDPGSFDVLGSLTSVLAVAGVVFGLLEAPTRGWSDPLVLVALIGGVVLGGLFIVIERRRTSPLLDVGLFRNRAFASGSLSVALQFFASFGVFYLILLLLQLIYGYSPLRSAFALIPMVVGVGVFALLGNWVAVRFHSLRFVLAAGIAIAGAGVLAIGIVDPDVYWKLAIMLGVCAVGIGLATAPSTTAIMSNTPLEKQGVGSAVNDTARELGAAIGIALAGSLVAAGYASRIGPTADAAHRQIAALDPASADGAADGIRRSLAGAVAVSDQLPPQAAPLADFIRTGAENSFLPPMQQACLVLGGILLAGAVFLGWFAPRQVIATEPEPAAGPELVAGSPVGDSP
ncbi:MFS transporter [Gordonia sp. PP30]|uniref:MFS transporter n=1 Tax=unclassified Gordonia (in: high G+C Gram-positive bacteria) TaxID=2657482 RepID=UPI001FFE591E|nr:MULTISPECIES: MFS transporter [unclassified Gordonia (in: high G+C Gram-positive bacteria)]UQE75647.1 MFS transporter [Gordonia sp. PP30]